MPSPTVTSPQVAVNDIGSAEDFLAAIDKTIKYFNDGDIVEGTIVKVDRDEVLLDIGYKTEGVIPSRELSIKHDVDPNEVVSVGDQIEALVLTKEDKEGRLILSKKRAQYERAWGTIEALKEADEAVKGTVIEVVKGGLILDIGLRGFLPASLVEMRRVRDLQPYIGKEIEAKIIELDKNRNNVVLSRRAWLEQTQSEVRSEFLNQLVKGAVRKGVVSSIVNFGAFVDLGGVDGLVHVSQDDGKSWKNVTPPELPKWTMINSVEPDPFNDGGCYIAATGYKLGDYQPYLYRTTDYGANWEKIVAGIQPGHFTRVVRCDPARQGLLYAGTEEGMYISFDNGKRWQAFQLNLPIVPITDLAIKNSNLIAATQGRSLWIIDDLSPLHQLPVGEPSTPKIQLFRPAPTHRMEGGGSGKASLSAGGNRQNGVFIHYFLNDKPGEKDTVKISILDAGGTLIKTFSTHHKENKLTVGQGANLFVWNMRYPDAEKFDGMVLWSYGLTGPKAVPGAYRVRLEAAGQTLEENFEILADPRSQASAADFKNQFEFVQQIGQKITDLHRAIKEIRELRTQMNELKARLPKDDKFKPVTELAGRMDSVMTAVENEIYQTKNRSSQDPLNFPVKLNDKLANLMGLNVGHDFPPTAQSLLVRDYLFGLADTELAKWKAVKERDLPEINRLVHSLEVDVLRLPEKKE